MKDDTSVTGEGNFSWRVPSIDGVRALAMLMVFTFHVWEFSGSPVSYANVFGYRINLLGAFSTFPAGVDLFMVLSGFCLFLPLCKSPAALSNWDVKKYFVRRVRRIVPPYYAAIVYAVLLPQLLVILFRLLHQEASWQPVPSLWQFLTHFLFIHTFFVQTWDGINASFWSLGLEAQFYLAFPLVIFGFRRFNTPFLWAMVGISILYRIVGSFVIPQPTSWAAGFLYSIFFLGRWMQFALGMAAAWTVAQHWKAGQWRNPHVGSMAVVTAIGIYAIAVSQPVQGITLFPMRDLLLAISFAGLITALCITKTPLRIFFENKAIVGLGFISYSFFLLHQPTAWYISELMKKKLHLEGIQLFFLLCTIGFILVLAISYVFFLLFERPFLNPAKPKEQLSQGRASANVQDQAAP